MNTENAETGNVAATDTTPTPATLASTVETFETLKAQLKAATEDSEIMRLSKAILKHKSDVEKAEAEKGKKEAEAMAGDREKLAKLIQTAVRGVVDAKTMLAVKAKGFTFTIDHTENEKGQLDPAGAVKVTGGCVLIVPAIRKASTGGGGGGSTGALKQQTGLSRHELIDQYATPEEKAEIAAAFDGADSRPDSARYSAEKPVIKRILADNPSLVKR